MLNKIMLKQPISNRGCAKERREGFANLASRGQRSAAIAGALCLSIGLMGALTGCTLNADKKPVTVTTTTSAEQMERLFWQAVTGKDWLQANALLAPNLVWIEEDGTTLGRDQLLDKLKTKAITAYTVGEIQVKANGLDRTVSYEATAVVAGNTQQLAATSVWQELTKGRAMTVHAAVPKGQPLPAQQPASSQNPGPQNSSPSSQNQTR